MKILGHLRKFFSKKAQDAESFKDRTLDQLPVSFREALALHNIFMAFGIPEDDIYVGYMDKVFQVIAFQNKDQPNQLEFCVDISDLDMDSATFTKLWSAAAKLYNASSSQERIDMTEATQVHKKVIPIVAKMLAKGFRSEAIETISARFENTKDLN